MIDNKPNFIVETPEDLDYLSKIFAGRRLPDGIKKNIIAWHNATRGDRHLIRFGDCSNICGGRCIKCDLDMYDWGGYAGDTQTYYDEYHEPCKGRPHKELVLLLLRAIDSYEYPTDAGIDWLNELFDKVGLTQEQGKRFYFFYFHNKDLINKNDKGEITGVENKPEEYM